MHRAAYRLAARVADAHSLEREFGAVAVLEVDHALSDLDECRSVGGGEIFAVANAEQQRRPVPRDHESRRIGFAHHRDRVGADQLDHALSHGIEQRSARLQVRVHQVGDDFGIGIGDELVALGAQTLAHLLVVLDDAVVHHRHAARYVRVGVLLRGHAVGRPARMRDAETAGQALRAGELFQLHHAAGRAHPPQHRVRCVGGLAVEHSDSRRVVAAVFQALQPLDQDRNDVPS